MLLITSVMLAACIVIACSIRPLFAEKKLRTQWLLWVGFTAVVSILIVAFPLYQLQNNTLGKLSYLPVVVSTVLLLQSLLVKRSVLYLKNIQSVEGVSIIDPLTGAYNRYYLEQRLDTEVARCHRYNTPLAVLALEIENFKKFNDEYGHHGGDIALKRVADQLHRLVRETDVVARYEAGKFILILPDTPEGNTGALLARLNSAVNNLVVIDGTALEKSVSIKINFGLIHCVLANANGSELIELAFESLKRSKEQSLIFVAGKKVALPANA